jgi:hypothetical protein
MAEPVYISVNVPNIITIGFIVVVVWTVLAAGISLWRQKTGGAAQ